MRVRGISNARNETSDIPSSSPSPRFPVRTMREKLLSTERRKNDATRRALVHEERRKESSVIPTTGKMCHVEVVVCSDGGVGGKRERNTSLRPLRSWYTKSLPLVDTRAFFTRAPGLISERTTRANLWSRFRMYRRVQGVQKMSRDGSGGRACLSKKDLARVCSDREKKRKRERK